MVKGLKAFKYKLCSTHSMKCTCTTGNNILFSRLFVYIYIIKTLENIFMFTNMKCSYSWSILKLIKKYFSLYQNRKLYHIYKITEELQKVSIWIYSFTWKITRTIYRSIIFLRNKLNFLKLLTECSKFFDNWNQKLFVKNGLHRTHINYYTSI